MFINSRLALPSEGNYLNKSRQGQLVAWNTCCSMIAYEVGMDFEGVALLVSHYICYTGVSHSENLATSPAIPR